MADGIAGLTSALSGRYQVQRELGRGGMAIVYLARDLRHDRLVALKVLHQELTASLGPERFLREIRITAQLQHPHILPLLDSGEEAAALWYTMPYVEGENLRQRIAREKQLGIGDSLQIAGHVAAAIGYAHRRGIVHRDIKPENILLESSGAMVADFGIARAVSAAADEKLTSTGLAVGTPAYMSPEQGAGGHVVDARSDVYSLGCMVYEMLAGQPPFSAPTAQGLLARHAVDPVPSLRTVRPTVPPNVERAVEKALAKVPADRFGSAEEFAAALTRPDAGVVDATAVVLAHARRAPRRRQAAAAAIVIAAGLATTVALWRRSHTAGPTVVPSAALIAVLPFRPSVSDTALERLGRDLVLTVSPTLDGVGDIRTVDAHTVLAQSPPSSKASSLEKDQALARAFGAGSVLRGSVLKVGSQVRLDAGLVTSDSAAKALARLSVTAPPDSIEALTNGLIKALLPQIWRGGTAPSPSIDGALRTKSTAALRAFLEGEHSLMGNQWDEAAEAYGRAIGADSSFWLAYSRYAYVVGWRFRPVDSTIDNALGRHIGDLPEVERLMLEAPENEKASENLARTKRLAERFPTNWFARMQYADALFHWAPLLGHTRAEARAALEETLRLNPRFVPGWDHLIQSVLGDRDTIGSARALDALTRLGAGPAFIEEHGTDQLMQYRLSDRLLRGDVNGTKALTDSVIRDVVAHRGGGLVGPAFAGFFASELAIQRRLLRLLPDWKRDASRMVPYLWAGRGAWDSALVVLDQFEKLGAGTDSTAPIRAYRLAAVGAWLGALPPEEAARRRGSAWAAARLLSGDSRTEVAWLDGMLAIVRRDRLALGAARSEVHAAALEAGDSSGFFDRSLAGFDLYLAGSRRQAARALAALEWEQAEEYSPRRFAVPPAMPINRLAAAEWLLAAGDTAQAVRLLNWVDTDQISGFTWAALKGLVELERGRIEDAQGHNDQALAHYRQFLVRYDAPMPSQRALVAEAREAVVRLSRRGDPSPR
jgi:TolB-like protein/tetratricopeptide (TPR) repeat protein